MNCPNCDVIMQPAKTPSANLGLFVQFLQCPNCGGLWFDRFDIAQIPQDQAYKIESLDEGKFKAVVPMRIDLRCPKDREALTEIKDIAIPKESQIHRCHKCEGIWLNHGELSEYKQGVLNKQKESDKFEKRFETDLPKADVFEKERIISQIGSQMMPLPPGISLRMSGGNQEQPFILSSNAVDLLKEVPQGRKMEVINAMAREHDERVESENRFINITMTILNLIFRLMMRG